MAAKKNEVYPLRIEGYGSAGEGVARLDGPFLSRVPWLVSSARCSS